MPYTWVKTYVDTRNRDRRGGHEGTDIYNDAGWNYNTPDQRKVQKRKANKQRRREHARITREAVHSWEAEAQWDIMMTFDPEWDEDSMYELAREYEEDDRYDYYEDYYNPYDYPDPYDWVWDDYDYYPNRPAYDPMHDRFVQKEDVGKTLAEILEEYTSRR